MTSSRAVWLSVIVTAAVGVFLLRFGQGLSLGWALSGSGDLHERWVEYGYVLAGVYPDPKLAGAHALAGMRRSVYPPYAFPMLWLFFGIRGWSQARIMVALTTAAAVAVMSWFGYRQLQRVHSGLAALGLVLPLLMTSVVGALEWGQFGYFCTGMVVLQFTSLERNHKYLAGFAWALAMLKPQIGLCFAPLFGFRRQWHGLFFGIAILVVLSMVTLQQTDVAATELVAYWFTGQDLSFSFGSIAGIPVNLERLIPGFSPDLVAKIAAFLGALGLYWLIRTSRKSAEGLSFLGLAGACAVVGRLAFYHRPHDDVMLFPALIAALVVAQSRQRRADWFIVLAMLATLAQPESWSMAIPRLGILHAVVWIALALHLLRSARDRPELECAHEPPRSV